MAILRGLHDLVGNRLLDGVGDARIPIDMAEERGDGRRFDEFAAIMPVIEDLDDAQAATRHFIIGVQVETIRLQGIGTIDLVIVGLGPIAGSPDGAG